MPAAAKNPRRVVAGRSGSFAARSAARSGHSCIRHSRVTRSRSTTRPAMVPIREGMASIGLTLARVTTLPTITAPISSTPATPSAHFR